MSIFEAMVIVCLIIILCVFCLIYTSGIGMFIDTVKSIMQKYRSKIFKRRGGK